jgi:hypothetical protein
MEKVPTRIAYKTENQDFQTDVYGYDVRPGLVGYAWFKLHLDKNTKETKFDDPHLYKSVGLGIGKLPPGVSAVDINADYLSFVYREAIAFINNRIGAQMVREIPIHFHLTTPALWSLEARSHTREAATRAGFGTRCNTIGIQDQLHMIDEPEAAAIAAITTTLGELPSINPFKVLTESLFQTSRG